MSVQEPLKGGIEYVEETTSIFTEIEDKGIIVLFTFIEDETSTVEASITDNFVESNHAVQDHIAIKPRIYRLRGCVGEVVYKGSTEWINAISSKINSNPVLSKTINAMKPINAISGVVSSATQSAINIVNQLESSYNRYKKMIEDNFLSARQRKLLNKMQESTVADLNRILELRIPVNLKGLKFETTLTKGDNYKRVYYLQSVSAHQGSNNFISDIEVTIKEFRIATTEVVLLDKNQYGGLIPNSSVMKQPEQNVTVSGEKTTITTENVFQKAENISAPKEKTLGQIIQGEYNKIIAKWNTRNYYKTTYQRGGSVSNGGGSW